MRSALQDKIRRRVQSNLESLGAIAENTACRLLRCQGGWYAILEVPRNLSEEDLTLSLLSDDDVVVHPGYFFEFLREAFLVLSLLPMPDIFAEGTGRILKRFSI
jgi:aspartate/methionine/tyrosine aminotransferase